MLSRPAWSLGFLLPVLILLLLLADVGLRLLPLDPFAFRAHEVMLRFPTPGGPFEANRSYRNEASYGDLASLGNLRLLL